MRIKLMMAMILLFLMSQATGIRAQCLSGAQITVSPPPVNDGYVTKTRVNFCINITGYNSSGAWIHGISIMPGGGWDTLSILPLRSPASVDLVGFWDFYALVNSVNTGLFFGLGFFYERPPFNNDPGDNFGDEDVTGNGTWNACWTIAADTTGANLADLKILITSDGISGSWGNSVSCTTDTVNALSALTNSTSCLAFFNSDSSGVVNNPIQFVNYTTGDNLHFFWDFADGVTDTSLNPRHTYLTGALYNVCLIVNDSANTCSDTTCKTINIVNTGVASLNFDENFMTYPNPVLGWLNVITNQSSGMIMICNLIGQEAYHQNINSAMTTIDVSNLSAGIYFLHFKNEKGKAVKKIRKE